METKSAGFGRRAQLKTLGDPVKSEKSGTCGDANDNADTPLVIARWESASLRGGRSPILLIAQQHRSLQTAAAATRMALPRP
ncbi:hypothetical protein PF003_g11203 [Phytophthora fragariae]|nr:hypothetical protein PF003_g11203 [Phytophthora fragariae]